MNSRFTRLIAGAVLVGGVGLGVAAPAFAQEGEGTVATAPSRDLESLKARCLAAISQRQDALGRLESAIGSAENLTDAHEATIAGIVDNTQAGLDGLGGQISAATTPEELRDLCPKIATDYRVYLVVLPQGHMTIGADAVDAVVAKSADAFSRLDEAIAEAAAAGADVTEAQAHRDAAAALIAQADSAVDGLADSVLGVTPASYNDGSGKTVLDNARATLRTTKETLKNARNELKAAVEALRGATA